MSSDGRKEQSEGGAYANSNDLIIDQGFPVLNTYQPAATRGDTEEDSLILPNFSFVSFPSALRINREQEENIIHDCDLTFTARTKEDSDAYSSGTTFFIPALMKPRCALEELALKIFQTYTKGLVPGKHYDVERSGAEWWTLVLDTTSENEKTEVDKGNSVEEEEEEEEDDEVGMHFDADYGLEAQSPNFMLHPRVATVTYLSSKGVPTFIMNKKSPPPSDEEKTSLNGSIDRGWISCPMLGKHIGFDGRFLHGAIGTFMPKGHLKANSCSMDNDERTAKRRKLGEGISGEDKGIEMSGSKRITFMVNVWINHCPIDAEVIDDCLCSRMKTYWENDAVTSNGSRLKGDSQYEKPINWLLESVEKSKSDISIRELTLPKGKSQSVGDITEAIDSVICNREVTINFRSTEEELNDVAIAAHVSKGKSLEVRFEDKVLDLEVGAVANDSDEEDEG